MKYAELYCKSNFSFLTGASHADELVGRAVELGYSALAITDENSLAGVVRAYAAARQSPLKLIVGAEIHLQDAHSVVLWATDRPSYGRLSRLLTVGRRRAPKGESILRFDDLLDDTAGLLAGIVPTQADLSGASFDSEDGSNKLQGISELREVFADRAYLLACLYHESDDGLQLARLQQLSRRVDVPLVAACDVLYHTPARMPLHDVLTAIKHQTTVADAGHLLQPNAQRYLHSIADRVRQFAEAPGAIDRTLEIADRCNFCLSQLRYEYPHELAPAGQAPIEYLRHLTWTGAEGRYPAGVPEKVRRQLEHELALIDDLCYEAYFLTVWDLVRFARSREILCQGRGSAANSAVCYCLGVTSVDPNAAELLFERFISRERNEAPDIDVDFEHERREEVLQYLYQKYGRERAGLTATVITYRSRSAIRDVGKALGFSLDRVDSLAKQCDGYHNVDNLPELCRLGGIDPQVRTGYHFCHLVNELLGFPRHLSQHVGGMVITRGRLDELAPIENAAMDERTVIQWDKNDLEELGILKVDCLCLGMLSAIRKCFQLVERHWNRRLCLASIPGEDTQVYDMICAADTVGVFQIESRGQMSMLPRLKPRTWYDLVIEVAIVRPGPIQGNMVHPYLRRRAGLEPETYPNEEIRDVLHRTLGVPIFQEQAMKLAIVAAGFTPGEADQLRRAMGAWRKTGVIEKFRDKLMTGMRAKGLGDEFAEQVFRQIRGFGEYGFPESHAASFALLVYVSAWLKYYFPAAFTASIINSLPMGFYAPAQLVADVRRHGVEARPVDVNHSDWDCTLEKNGGQWALRLGLRMISGLPSAVGQLIVAARQAGPFETQADFARRTKLGQAPLTRLSDADAFGSLDQDRRAALWQALGQDKQPLDQPLFSELTSEDDDRAPLPDLTPIEQVFADYRATGLSLKAHPLSFYRESLRQAKVVAAAELSNVPDGRYTRIGGLVILRQRPSTAKGITFVTLEDESGTANLVVKPEIWQRYKTLCRTSAAWIAHGKLEKRSGVIHLVVQRLEDLAQVLSTLRQKSRDFR